MEHTKYKWSTSQSGKWDMSFLSSQRGVAYGIPEVLQISGLEWHQVTNTTNDPRSCALEFECE